MENSIKTLVGLEAGQLGVISGFADDLLALKLIEMGCIPGEKIILQHTAPLGCPLAYEVNGTLISLRKSEAEKVLIN